jgi:multiple sugar transport system permease protein
MGSAWQEENAIAGGTARFRFHLTLSQREAIEGYLAISPWIIGFIAFVGGPIVASLFISLTDWPLIEAPTFIGLVNFGELFRDPLFWQALKVTVIYTFGSVPLAVVLGFSVALLLNQDVKALALWRTIYYLPAVVSGVAVATVWIWVLQPDFGVLNTLLRGIGIEGPNWLFSRTWVIPSLILMSLWGVGGGIVIYLAGLQGIPTEIYEAASIDGANAVGRLLHVTIPMMTPVLFLQLVMGLIGSFQSFIAAYVMTQGGPGNASLLYVLYIYRHAFQYLQMGYASALAWILTIVIVAVTLLLFWSAKYWVFYEAEVDELEVVGKE